MEFFKGFEHIVSQHEPLAPYTWLRIGGPAEFFAEPNTVEELTELVKRCKENELPVRLLGSGSNLLVKNEGVPGLVLRLAHPNFSSISINGNIVTAGGGAKLSHVVSSAVGQGLAGLEALVGIPGTIGGALHTNAESSGSDIGRTAVRAKVLTRNAELFERTKDDMQFAYHHSSLDELVILEADLELESTDAAELTRKMQKNWIVKKSNQPPSDLNVASPFLDPADINASSMIEQAGLKGTSVGGAQISETHGNYIVATDSASAEDIIRLMDLVRSRVHEVFGIELKDQLIVW